MADPSIHSGLTFAIRSLDVRHYHVFLASPGDVEEERKAVREYFRSYNLHQAGPRGLSFDVVDWEHFSTAGVGRPQEVITDQTLEKFGESLVLVIGIMDQRFGSPSGVKESGTEEEFEWAVENKRRCGFPEVKWFFRDRKKLELPVDDPDVALEQWKKVKSFRDRLKHELKVFCKSYVDPGAFAKLLEEDLGQWLNSPDRPWFAATKPKQDVVPVESNDLQTGPLTISAVLKGPGSQVIGDAYPTGDNGVHFVFSLFNGNRFDFSVNKLAVDVLAYESLDLDHLMHGVGAIAVRRSFRATIRPERGSYVARYLGRKGTFVTIPPGKSEGFDVEILTRSEGLFDICLRVYGASAGKGFDLPLNSTKRRIAFFDRRAGYMVDRGWGLGSKMLTYDEYSLEMKSGGQE